MKYIPYGRQYIDKNDISAVTKVLKNDLITSGKKVLEFEKKLIKYLKCKYLSVCNSGTSAIHLSLSAINLKKDDIVIMPAINFISSFNIAKTIGAKIYLADVNKETGQMHPEHVEECCKKFNIKKVKVIIVMYNGGYPNNAKKFIKLKKRLNCFIIEDACHALGASYKNNNSFVKIGSCLHSDICTFSLHPLKTITTGEGGIVSTNSKFLDKRIKMFRSLGIQRSNNNHWQYDVNLSGFNFRLNEFQCALGISQLKKINLFLKKRKQIAQTYDKELKKIKNLNIPEYSKNINSSYHLYLVNSNFLIKDKNRFFNYMKKNKIIVQYHYIPIYKFSNFKGNYINKNAEIYFRSTFSLPIYYQLSKSKQIYILNKLKEFFSYK
jgi:dTDP-4-amino-4,6-dideoxygalactose transaminase